MGARDERPSSSSMKAQQLILHHVPGFKASDGWVCKFFRRNHLTLRAKTSLSQMLPEGLENKIKVYLQKVQKERNNGRFPKALIGITSMDPAVVRSDYVLSKVLVAIQNELGHMPYVHCTTLVYIHSL